MISVVMASYLGWYKGSASNKIEKFHRAIESFLLQGVGELIVVADGCQDTINELKKYNSPNIRSVLIDKQPMFSGDVRQQGIKLAMYDWICYLDTDDEFKSLHLQTIINSNINECDWVYYDDIVNDQYRSCTVELNKIGTSNIAHRASINAVWPNGYGHDWQFIQQLGNNYKKIENTGYVVHHIKKGIDN